MFLYEWMCLVVFVSIDGFVANEHWCGVCSRIIMCGVCLLFGVEFGVGEKREFGFDTVLYDRESRNHPVEWMTLDF